MTLSPLFLRSSVRPGGRRGGSLDALAVAALALSACGAHGQPAASRTAGSGASDPSATSVPYRLHMDFFSRESRLPSVTDPQVFVSKPAAPAGTGPQKIDHVAGVAPAAKTDPPATPLLGADGKQLGITLGQWEKAAGSLSLTCTDGRETAASRLTGLIPGGLYSLFVVHLTVQGPGRFTPFGDAAGTTNNFTASADGTATSTNTVTTCLNGQEAVVVIWHSDQHAHGASGGRLGVGWHNSVIARVP